MRNRPRAFLALTALAAGAPVAALADPAGDVTVTVTGLRSDKGQVMACLTARADRFPQCARDPHARSIKTAAGSTVELDFGAVPAGRYAISLFHDENGNGRMDKRLAIPREGYGFSRNAPVRFGPPSFERASFVVDAAGQHQNIRVRYIF